MGAHKNPVSFPAAAVGRAHTILATTAFASALCIASLLHYKKIVKNSVAAYPQEWFPSVSATIGDWYPERNIFQILIAVTSIPRFTIVALQYYLHRSPTSSLPTLVFIFGLIRTLSCGGWVYITSSDDHDIHDIMMITYMVCNIPWMIGGIKATPLNSSAVRRKRTYISTAFFVTIIPLIYYFIQHKVHRIPGAYTRYAFFEWGLIFFDIMYDSVTEQEFREANLHITVGSLSSHPLITSEHPNDIAVPAVTPDKLRSESTLTHTTDKGLEQAAKLALSSPTIHQRTSFVFTRSVAGFASDVYLSYIFWSILTSLIPTLFYFSIWELGIAGQELALLSVLSPVFLSAPSLLKWVESKGGQTTLHILSFSGLAAYLLDKPLDRLFAVAFANVVLMIRQTVEWAGQGEGDSSVGYRAIVTGLGLMISALFKHANHSNNPVWPFIDSKNGGYNKIGLLLAFLSVLFKYRYPNYPGSSSVSQARRKASGATPSWFPSAISLGSLLFSAHNLLAEPSTLVAWSWTGYTDGQPRGPVPHLHGFLTLIAQSVGLLVPLILPSSVTTHPFVGLVWLLYGVVSAYVMYTYKDWIGYAGSLNHALFLMSIFPLILQGAADTGKVAKTYTTAMLIYCLFNLASIFTAAYAFVPGGQFFRERTDLVTIAQMVGISFAFRSVFRRSHQACYTIPQCVKSYTRIVLACISILSVLVSVYRLPSLPPKPYKPGPRVFNAGIWTIHFGFDNIGHDSQRGVRKLVRDMQLDIVGLLETDLHRTAFGHRDLTRVIVEEGYNVDIGPGPNSHTWGCVLLTKFPIINTTHHLLPSPHGELAPAIEAVLDVYGTLTTVVISHNGQEEDALDRELQSKKLAEIMSASPYPVIFLGYVVTKPHAQRPNPYEIMVKDGNVFDIDHEDLDRWCEYIFYRGLYRTAYARVSRGIITDTEMQIGQFVHPKFGYGVSDASVEARYLRARKEELPEPHWFPMEYYGSPLQGGVDGHFYHVFGTPLYYKLPQTAIV